MSFEVQMQSETFAEENGTWISEGVTQYAAPCRFFYKKDGSFSLAYDEKTEESTASSRLSYDASEGTLTLSRFGDTRYTAVFGSDPCSFVYAVSSFAFDAVAKTEALAVNVCDEGGTISLSYRLTIGDVPRYVTLSFVID